MTIDNHFLQVDATYPRSVATWWLGCPNQGENTEVQNPYAEVQISHSEIDTKDEQWIVVEDDGVYDAVTRTNSVQLRSPSFSISLIICIVSVLYNVVLR